MIDAKCITRERVKEGARDEYLCDAEKSKLG
jgi:hypothetical protein